MMDIDGNIIPPGTLAFQDVLYRTHLMTQSSFLDDTDLEPVFNGSGFFVRHCDETFFVTADHNLHCEDYNNADQKRTGEEFRVSVYNNVNGPELSTVITPLGGFQYLTSVRANVDSTGKIIDTPDQLLEKMDNALQEGKPVDITACILKPISKQYPFLTPRMKNTDGTNVEQQSIISFTTESMRNPIQGERCQVYGQVHFKYCAARLDFDNVIQQMTFQNTEGDDLVFFSDNDIVYDDWKGLSGSPIISVNDGKCVGVLLRVYDGGTRVIGIGINKIMMLITMLLADKE